MCSRECLGERVLERVGGPAARLCSNQMARLEISPGGESKVPMDVVTHYDSLSSNNHKNNLCGMLLISISLHEIMLIAR